MKNVMKPVIDAWFDLLDGNIVIGDDVIPVFKEDPANYTTGHYVLLQAESETDDSNKTAFVTNPVVVVDIVTVHSVSVKRSVVESIDDQIRQIVWPTRKCALVTTGFQISNVTPSSANYLEEDDGSKRYYRKVTRFTHRINQL